MDNKDEGAQLRPAYAELEECLRQVAQSLEWHAHGCCRGFHEAKPLRTSDATRLARSILDRCENQLKISSNHDAKI